MSRFGFGSGFGSGFQSYGIDLFFVFAFCFFF